MKLANALRGEQVLDAGCGEGTIPTAEAARLAGAENVYGIDRSSEMLARARKNPNLNGVTFDEGIIQELPYNNEKFNLVLCIAVLIHSDPTEFRCFLEEAHRVLKPGGRLVVGLMAPELYLQDSANIVGTADWSSLRLLDNQYNPDIPQPYSEIYRNGAGGEFDSTVWCYPDRAVAQLMKDARLTMQSNQKTYVTKKALASCGFDSKGPVDYPAFSQILATKQ
jgi:SAM-dependent methyltransferase